MVFSNLLLPPFRSNLAARDWLSCRPAGHLVILFKKHLVNTGLVVVVTFYSGIGGAEILPANTAETQVSSVNNVPVVNIARPTMSGVSKNQFNDFDVDNAGVVINNARFNGTSRNIHRFLLARVSGSRPVTRYLRTSKEMRTSRTRCSR